MKLPELKIDGVVAKLPIIQGGMAIRISTGELAGAVAAAGGIGVIGASGMTFDELASEIKLARAKAQGGIIGINIMYAAREFWGIVRTAIKEKIDLVFTGAGFSRDIFKLGEESNTPIIPIVSSARLAKTSERCGAKAVVVEGKEAGGHLGTDRSIKDILPEVRKAVKLPVVAAGGITNGQDIVELIRLGADGVQIATLFVLSNECNAALPYKQHYQKAKKGDVVRITSPVGMPGSALRSAFVNKVLEKKAPKPIGCDFCLKHCSLEYCIIQALINSQQGDTENGIVFSGENVWKIKNKNIRPAADIIKDLLQEVEEIPA
ncbi:NAD(P)H-dependent flavin oxidoreductase [Candidatus Margulisiibacteriota bacterium]